MSLTSIPPELFPLIASFIPLRSAPKTLLALTLASRHFYWIARPLLYSRIVVGSEDVAIAAFRRILKERHLGMAITEIHLMAELSKETRERKKPFDVMSALIHILVKRKLVPRLVALGIYLLDGWQEPVHEGPSLMLSYIDLKRDFWRDLRVQCPRLRSVSLRNLGYSQHLLDSWLEGYHVLDEIMGIPGLSTLRLECDPRGQGLTHDPLLEVFNNLPQIATSLHTLSLNAGRDDIDPILSIHFVNLKWLCLSRFKIQDQAKLMEFFRRHSQLESLSIINSISTWFPEDIDVGDGFLPNLRHLKTTFNEILHLAPILPQLISLSITKSYNCQVPYLLRAVLPNGLPGLRSLELNQTNYEWNRRGIESLLWYETVEGLFRIETEADTGAGRSNFLVHDFRDNYLQSIVRGAPNLEELGLHFIFPRSNSPEYIAPTLAQLKNIKRFYCDSSIFSGQFLFEVEALGQACASLERVTSIGGSDEMLPYLAGIIERNSAGEVVRVWQSGNGVGMEIPAQDDEPFPYNPETLRSFSLFD